MLNKEEIPIFFSTDDNYIPFVTVAVRSIIDNSSDENNYRVIVLNTGLKKENELKVKALEKENFKIDFVNINSKVENIADKLSLRLRDYYSNSIYLRLFIPSLFKEYDKVLYLDADIVVVDDIANLYNEDVGDNLLGVATDDVVNSDASLLKYTTEVFGLNAGEYFNSGILIMNLDGLRKEKIEEKFLHLLEKYNFDTVAPDQDYLNFLCKGKVKFIHKGWDRMPIHDNSFDDKDLHLIHYNMFYKPWHYEDVMYSDYFWEYAKKTEFYNSIRGMLDAYSEEKKQRDENAAMMLVENALRIVDEKNTFKNALDINYFENF